MLATTLARKWQSMTNADFSVNTSRHPEERTMLPAYHFPAASYPATHRQREVEIIVAAVRARKSILISGPSGMGKSHLMRFLVSNQDFRRFYFPKDAANFAFFLFDCNALESEDERSFYRVVITELCQRAKLEIGNKLQGTTREELLISLKGCLDSLYREQLTLVFVFDRFEKLYQSPWLGHMLDALRYLRDHFAGHLSYILAARGKIDVASVSEEFEDLLYHPAVLYLKPLTMADAEVEIELYGREYDFTFDHQGKQKLISCTGGYPRLLQTACELAREGKINLAVDDAEVVQQLLNNPHIQNVCERILENLSDEGQADLRFVLMGLSPLKDNSSLVQYGLVTAQVGQPKLFCPLFEAFVQGSKGTEMDLTLQIVSEGLVQRGTEVIHLSAGDFRFLRCLLEKPGEVCSYDDIIHMVYPREKVLEGVASQALTAMAKRVRGKINIPGYNFIENVRSVGYCIHLEPGTVKKQK
jgi:DNA-binding winged helix-turn-helix (wHTH) protein